MLFKGKALVLIGARQVGKTTVLKSLVQKFENTLWLNADELNIKERLTNPTLNTLSGIVGNYKIVVIDEIQRIENAGLLLKLLVDNFKNTQFIATGSSALEISETIFEPMTGRQFTFHLFPFSLQELYNNKSPFEIELELPFHLVYGCYPEVCTTRNIAEMILSNLAQQYLYKDVLVWKDIRKPQLLDKLLRLLAFQLGAEEVSINELANQPQVKQATVESYIDLLEKSFVIYRLKAHSSNSRKEVTKMSKILFWDNGIRNAIIEDFRDLTSRNDQGVLFENFMISERIKQNSWQNPKAKSHFWRNLNQSEVDYVEVNSGKLSGYEFKWNTTKNNRVTRAFTNIYPDADTKVITPTDFVNFAFLKE